MMWRCGTYYIIGSFESPNKFSLFAHILGGGLGWVVVVFPYGVDPTHVGRQGAPCEIVPHFHPVCHS